MKKLLSLFLFLLVLSASAQKTDATLKTTAEGIRDATVPGSNTATKVGGMFVDLVNNKRNIIDVYSTSGTNAYTISTTPLVMTSYVSGQTLRVKFVNANTGTCTVNVNSIAPINLKKFVSGSKAVLTSGDIPAGKIFDISYDGTDFQIDIAASITATGWLTTGTTNLTGDVLITDNGDGHDIQLQTAGDASIVADGTASLNATNIILNGAVQDINGVAISGSSTPDLTVVGSATVSGTNTGDKTIDELLPDQSGNANKFLKTNGTTSLWEDTPPGVRTLTGDGIDNTDTSNPILTFPTLTEILTIGTSAGSHKITNVTDPTSAQDAATKAYVDANIGGSASFQTLVDGPGSFTGKSLNYPRVNVGETLLEYRTPSQVRSDIGAGTGDGTVTGVSGTTNRITSTGGATPILDVSATFEALLGKVADPLSQFASTTSAQLRSTLSDELGTGAALFDGATPTSLVGTNISGTAAGLTAGNVTTNANLTGDVTSSGNSTTLSSTAVTPGSYTNTNLTVDAKGRITAASNGSSGLTVGTTSITSGTTTKVLYDNAGILGEYTVSGSGNIAMTTSPVFTTPNIGTATGSITGNAATVTTNANLTGEATSVGNATTLTNSAVIAKVLTGYTSGAGTLSSSDNILQAFQKLDGNDQGKWSLSTNGTFTAPLIFTGSSTNTLKFLFPSLGTTQTNGAGHWLANTTAATLGNQQVSPSIVFEGQGWETAGGTSQSAKFRQYVLPVQASALDGILNIGMSTNGGAYVDFAKFRMDSDQSIAAYNSAGTLSTYLSYRGMIGMGASGTVYMARTSSSSTSPSLTGNTLSFINKATWQGTTARGMYFQVSDVNVNGSSTSTAYDFQFETAGFSPSAGTTTGVFASFRPVINTTSTYAGLFVGLNYEPTLTSVTGLTHVGLRVTAGSAVLGHSTVTSGTTRLQVRGIGTTTGKLVLFEDNGGTERLSLTDAGNLTIGTATNIVGTATNNNATAGNIGEYVESKIASGSAVSLTTTTTTNVTSISLTAGDWDVTGNVNYTGTLATVTGKVSGISTTSATMPTDGTEVYSGVTVSVTSNTDGCTMATKRISISGTTTVYLVGQTTFSAGSVVAFGYISARRVR